MPSLNVDLDYFTHRKTVRLSSLIGRHAPLFPIRLWAYVGKYHCEDGSLKDYSAQEIESILGWSGKKSALLDALITVGFLDKIQLQEVTSYQVHDWLEHAGHLAAFRKRGKANAEKRWGKIADVDAKQDATSIADSTATQMLPLNLLNPPSLLSPPNPLGAGASAPPTRKCAYSNGENCQEYAIAGSKFCPRHKEFYRSVRERMSGNGPS